MTTAAGVLAAAASGNKNKNRICFLVGKRVDFVLVFMRSAIRACISTTGEWS